MLEKNHQHSLPKEDDDWRSFLIGNARSFMRALLAYRDGARIHAGTRPSGSQLETAEAQLRFLCAAGFSTSDAAYALMPPLLKAAVHAFDEDGPDAAFEYGLAMLVDGLAKRILITTDAEGLKKVKK